MLTAIIPVAVKYEISHKESYQPIIVKRMTAIVPLSSNVILAGDENSMSVSRPASLAAAGPSMSRHLIQEASMTSHQNFVNPLDGSHRNPETLRQ